MEGQNNKRVRDDSVDSELGSPEVKRLRDDLLGFLDDSDLDSATLDLDSVMKSFEEEISALYSPAPVVDLTSNSAESRSELGYLLEASNDELGIPPIPSTSEEEKKAETDLIRFPSDSSGIGEFWDLEDQIPSSELFELRSSESYGGDCNKIEYATLDGLLQRSDDIYFDSSDYSDFSWRHESLPAQ